MTAVYADKPDDIILARFNRQKQKPLVTTVYFILRDNQYKQDTDTCRRKMSRNLRHQIFKFITH